MSTNPTYTATTTAAADFRFARNTGKSLQTFTVHHADCPDQTKAEGWATHMLAGSTRLDLVADVYTDHLGDHGLEPGTPEGDAMLEADYAPEVRFHTCTKALFGTAHTATTKASSTVSKAGTMTCTCGCGEALPVTKFPTKKDGSRGTVARAHRTR